MGYLPILLIVWGVVLTCFLILLAYNANVTRYEEDQLFLSDTNEIEKRSQDDILRKVSRVQPEISAKHLRLLTLRKVSRVQPYLRVFGSLSAILTLGVMGLMSWNAWQSLGH